MHVLLLKEPRDGESGPDPYIKVRTLAFFFAAAAAVVKEAIHFAFHLIML